MGYALLQREDAKTLHRYPGVIRGGATAGERIRIQPLSIAFGICVTGSILVIAFSLHLPRIGNHESTDQREA